MTMQSQLVTNKDGPQWWRNGRNADLKDDIQWDKPWWGQSKAYDIGISCFFAKHTPLKSKRKDWLTWNQDNVSEWSDMSTVVCCFSELAL